MLPLFALLVLINTSVSATQKYETVFHDNDGRYSVRGLLKGSDGVFYGTTAYGGASDLGTIFKVTPDGTVTTVLFFNGVNGSSPGALVDGSEGFFYGTTLGGGANNKGTIFKITPEGEITTLVSFNGSNGSAPVGPLVKASDGAFYGATRSGGLNDDGTIFKMTPAGELTTLFSFNEYNGGGKSPSGELVEGSDGNFYGLTSIGGQFNEGTVFKVSPGGVLTTLVSFTGGSGSSPLGGLVEGSNGVFYGTTSRKWTSNIGTVFKVTSEGVLTVLATEAEGHYPKGTLVKGSDGNFYGTAYEGGDNDKGMVLKLTPEGVLTTLVSFDGSNGSAPNDRLVMGNDGAFYGTTSSGGTHNCGTVFKVTTDGELTTLSSLGSNKGLTPKGDLVIGNNGAFYGTTETGGTSNFGTVFKVTPDGEYTTLASFDGVNGRTPSERLVKGSDGTVYGTTEAGGANGYGTIFKVTPGGEFTTLVSLTFKKHGNGLRFGPFDESDGTFYGTNSNGPEQGVGQGTVFKMTPAGELVDLTVFVGTNGKFPVGGLVLGSDGSLYGTTVRGGAHDRGTVFKMTQGGEVTLLASFNVDRTGSSYELVEGADGAFYGTVKRGGANDQGMVFRVTPAGELTTLVSFNGNNGSVPESGLTKGHDGALYGTTSMGGANGLGTVFKVTTTGEFTTLHSFEETSATKPRGTPVFGTDGQLYGTANPMTIWRISWSSVPAVTTNAAGAISATEATLHASVTPNGAPTSVWFEYGTSTEYGNTTAVQNVGRGVDPVPASQLLTLIPHTTYHFRAVVQNSEGTAYGENRSFTTLNRAPVTTSDIVTATYAHAEAITVLANDTDADGDTLNVLSFTQPTHGEVTRAEGNQNVLVYVPDLGFSGTDMFTYRIGDGYAEPVAGFVEITVGSQPTPSSSMAQNTGAAVPGSGVAESGIPTGATWRTFGAPAINDAGQVAVLGHWKSPEGNGSGVFVNEQLVVKAGDPVPGLASVTFKSFTDPVLNGAGRVAFLATITGSGVKKSDDTALVSNAFSGELELIAREGDEASETGAARFGKFYNISLLGDTPEEAGLLFTAGLAKGSGTPKVTPSSDLGAWLLTSDMGGTPLKVVREGDPGFVAGEKIKSFELLKSLSGSPAQGRGHYKADELSFVVTLSTKRQALVRFIGDELTGEEFTGELSVPAMPEAEWTSFGLPATGSAGALSAVRVTAKNGPGGSKANASVILISGAYGTGYTQMAEVGGEAFGVAEAVFTALGDPLVSGTNSGLAFLGTFKESGARSGSRTGIWWQTAEELNVIGRSGTQAAEAPQGALWKSISSLALPEGERGPLFVATLARGAGSVNASNDQGIWAVDSLGETRLLARKKDPVQGKTLKSFSALQAVNGSAGVKRSFNNTGQLVYRAYFSDGTQGVVKVQVP